MGIVRQYYESVSARAKLIGGLLADIAAYAGIIDDGHHLNLDCLLFAH